MTYCAKSATVTELGDFVVAVDCTLKVECVSMRKRSWGLFTRVNRFGSRQTYVVVGAIAVLHLDGLCNMEIGLRIVW